MNFFKKMRGTSQSPPRVSLVEVTWSWVGAFVGMVAVGWIYTKILDASSQFLMIGSLGASAVLVFGAVRSPLAQPRNVVGGHVLSALIGVWAAQVLGTIPWLAGALAVATAIALMHLTKTLHPPGGATALIAVIGGDTVHTLGYWYPFTCAGLGAVVLVGVGLVVNNIPSTRRYPEFWI